MKNRFTVKGMSCSACALGIEKKLRREEGITKADVSLVEGSLTAEYDEKVISSEDIIALVRSLGYEVITGDERSSLDQPERLKTGFFVSLGLLVILLYFSLGSMMGLPMPSSHLTLIIEAVLTGTILVLNRRFFIKGTKAVIARSPDMDTLVMLSAGASFLYSIVLTILAFIGKVTDPHVFYASAAMVVTLVTLGKWLEARSVRRTGRELEKLKEMVPKESIVVDPDGKEHTVATSSLKLGDVVLYRVGDSLAVDGLVVSGRATLDKSAMTGESLPVAAGVGNQVVSGSIVRDGFLTVRATAVGGGTLFSKVIDSVRSAGASKAPVQRMADKIAGIFVPTVCAIALVTFIIWIITSHDLASSFSHAVSVLVVSCPCALGLATPVAVMAATGRAASKGILFKDAAALEKIRSIDAILLDKTATLTEGKPQVKSFIPFIDEDKVKRISSALEAKSSHPLAQCLLEYCGASKEIVSDVTNQIGEGTAGIIESTRYRIGSARFIRDVNPDEVDKLAREHSAHGETTVFLADDHRLLALYGIADRLKASTSRVIKTLTTQGYQVMMATGDNAGVAATIAKEAGITRIASGVLPDGKARIVKEWQEEGHKVAMVGDGINDSPALKTADLGIAMGNGTDIAMESADIVLVRGDLEALVDLLNLGRKANRIIRENLFWAFFYNVLAIPLAAGVFASFGLYLTPSISACCMSLSSLFVTTNALRILKGSEPKKEKKKAGKTMKTIIHVEGMMCNGCAMRVKDALKAVHGVKKVKVKLLNKTATVEASDDVTLETLEKVIQSIGYDVKE